MKFRHRILNISKPIFYIFSAVLVAAFLIVTPRKTSAEDFVFVDGYGGDVNTAQDNMLHSLYGSISFGGHNVYDVSTTRRFIQRFDLSSIPSDATSTSAQVHYYKTGPYVPNQEVTCTLYSILEANAAWQPGTIYGGEATEGDSTWDALAADGSGGVQTPWAGSAGLSTPGVDYDPNPIGSFTIPYHASIEDEYIAELDTTRVQGWFGADNTNYGILMVCDGKAEYITTSEFSDTTRRPKLVVNYSDEATPPPPPQEPKEIQLVARPNDGTQTYFTLDGILENSTESTEIDSTRFIFSDGWTYFPYAGSGYSPITYSTTDGPSVTFLTEATTLDILTAGYPEAGSFDVYIDGVYSVTVNAYSDTFEYTTVPINLE